MAKTSYLQGTWETMSHCKGGVPNGDIKEGEEQFFLVQEYEVKDFKALIILPLMSAPYTSGRAISKLHSQRDFPISIYKCKVSDFLKQ